MARPDTSVDQTKMVLSDIDTEALEQTTYALRATGADVHAVANADQVEELAKQALNPYGAVKVLCNNAGVLTAVQRVGNSGSISGGG